MKRSELVDKLNTFPDIDVVVMCDYVNDVFDVIEDAGSDRCCIISVTKPEKIAGLNHELSATPMSAHPINIKLEDLIVNSITVTMTEEEEEEDV